MQQRVVALLHCLNGLKVGFLENKMILPGESPSTWPHHAQIVDLAGRQSRRPRRLAGMVSLNDLLKARTSSLEDERRRERVLRIHLPFRQPRFALSFLIEVNRCAEETYSPYWPCLPWQQVRRRRPRLAPAA